MLKPTAQTNTDQADISPAILEELILWSVKLRSGTASVEDAQRFTQWCSQDPAHEAAWQKLHAMEQTLNDIPADATQLITQTIALADTQLGSMNGRRNTLKPLAISAITLIGLAMLINQYGPWQQRLHYATSMGQRAQFILADGTQLMLNTDSSVEVHYSLWKRQIVLNHGEVYIETGHDKEAIFGRRAFWVNSSQVNLEAIGTRFSVHQQATATQLYVAEGIVAMHIGQQLSARAYAHESYRMQGSASMPLKVNIQHTDPMAWVDGVIVAKQMRLDVLITELLRYQALPLHYEAEVGDLMVSGVFQLNRADAAEHALQVIAQTLPVRILHQDNRIVLRKK